MPVTAIITVRCERVSYAKNRYYFCEITVHWNVARATVTVMDEKLLAAQRRELLVKAIDRLTQGDRSAFGRRLGFKDGAFIRQMLSGARVVSDKTVRLIEAVPGMQGWFSQASGSEPPPLAPLPLTELSPTDIASRYHVAPKSAQRIVELALRQPQEPVPSWATPALLSVLAASLLLADDDNQTKS